MALWRKDSEDVKWKTSGLGNDRKLFEVGTSKGGEIKGDNGAPGCTDTRPWYDHLSASFTLLY